MVRLSALKIAILFSLLAFGACSARKAEPVASPSGGTGTHASNPSDRTVQAGQGVAALRNPNRGIYDWSDITWDGTPFRPRVEKDCGALEIDETLFGEVRDQVRARTGQSIAEKAAASVAKQSDAGASVEAAARAADNAAIVTRDQGDTNLCYAYSSSDLATHCLAQVPGAFQGWMKQVSAFDMSYVYAETVKNHDRLDDFVASWLRGGGDPRKAMEIVSSRGGVCEEDNLTSDGYSFRRLLDHWSIPYDARQPVGTQTALLEKLMALYREYMRDGKLACARSGGQGCFPELSKVRPDLFGDEGWTRFLGGLNGRPEADYLPALDRALCPKRIPLGDCDAMRMEFPPDGNPGPVGQVLFPGIDAQLARKQPVGFVVTSNFLQTDAETGGRNHSMVVVGRRFIDGECRYKVRNSFGDRCEYFNGLEHRNVYSRWVTGCREGSFWVSESTLQKNLVVSYYINN